MAKKKTVDQVPPAPNYRVWGADDVLYGPVDLPTLVEWIQTQQVTADSWVYQDPCRAWAQAGAIEELRPLFQDVSRTRAKQVVSAMRGGVNSEALDRVKLLAGLSDQQLVSFLQYMEILTLEPYFYAVREGENGDAMYLILEGELRVQVTRDGIDTILATLVAGDFFGEISLLDRGPRSADVIANERSTLLKISESAFGRLRRQAPALAEPFLFALGKRVVGRLRDANKRYDGSIQMLQALAASSGL